MPIRIALVEDNPTLLRTIKENLSHFEEIDVIWTAMDGKQAIRQTEKYQPQVILMDIEMPVMDGISTTMQIGQIWPSIKVLILLMGELTCKESYLLFLKE